MTYRYGSILRVQNNDPTNNIDEDDIIIEAGQYEDGDAYQVLGPDNTIHTVRMETIAVYDNGESTLSESEAKQFAKERYIEDEEGGDDGE